MAINCVDDNLLIQYLEDYVRVSEAIDKGESLRNRLQETHSHIQGLEILFTSRTRYKEEYKIPQAMAWCGKRAKRRMVGRLYDQWGLGTDAGWKPQRNGCYRDSGFWNESWRWKWGIRVSSYQGFFNQGWLWLRLGPKNGETIPYLVRDVPV